MGVEAVPRLSTALPMPGPSLVVGMLAFAAVALGAIGLARSPAAQTGTELASLSLSDDDGGNAMFSAAAMAPGVPLSRCIRLRYAGQGNAATVRLSAVDVRGALVDNLSVRAERGTGGRYGDCSGFTGAQFYAGSLRRLSTTPADAVSDPTGWRSAADAPASFRITVTYHAAAPPPPGSNAMATFVWRLPDGAATSAAPATAPSRHGIDGSGAAGDAGGVSPAPAATDGQGKPGLVIDGGHAQGSSRSGLSSALGRLFDQFLRHAAIPIILILILILFLILQDQVDKRDPKLALAPVWRTRYIWIQGRKEARR
jgi:hypothetical protein